MKVLWFSLSPGLSDAHLNNNYEGCGWIKSLEKNIQDKIDLSIVFYHDAEVEPFTLGPTQYFPIKRYNHGNLTKVTRRLLNYIEPDYDIKSFLKVIDRVKPDLIHIHGTESPFGLVQKFVNIPTVVSIQGTITVYRHKFFSSISYFDVLKHSYLKSFLFARSFINVYKQFTKVAAREREIYRYSKHFIGRTDWDRRVTKVLAKSAQYYQNDEILRSSFYKFKHHSKLSGRLVLFTTTWTNLYKGLETVFDCANLLDENSVDYEWRIAGLNADDEIVRIAARSTKRSTSGNIKFLGMLNEQALVQALLLANIYVAPSHIENSPNSLCEAQILGLPCIATCAGGTSSLLEDHNEGILIQDGDPFAMAGAVMELNENYPRAVMMGKNGRERALTRHDPERITGALLEIYDSILASASNRVTSKEDSQLIAKNGDA